MGEHEETEITGAGSGLDATLASFTSDGEAGKLSAEVFASMQARGYAHIEQPLTAQAFDAVAQQLGTITLRTDLTLTPDRSSIVYKSAEINFHQDNPTMNILGWYCVRQDALDGSMRLLDAGDVADHFSRRERQIMSSINVRCPDPDPGRHNPDRGLFAYFLWPLLTEKRTRSEVYYAPWLLLDAYDEEQQSALAKFAAYLRAKEANQLINIRLKAGESLFIDNNRLLHGRGAIQPASQRFLKRVWIKRQR